MPDQIDDIFYGAQFELFERARKLRQVETNAEKILWERLRNRKLKGFKFRRQHPIAYFIADFYCHEARLVIEIDGGVHNIHPQKECDEDRTAILQSFGIKVVRFTNKEIERALESVLKKIADILPHPRPLSIGEGSGERA